MTKIKICGLKTEQDVAMVNQMLPDYIGFIINIQQSKRNLSIEQVTRLSRIVNHEIQKVGVFLNEAPPVIINLINEGIIDIVQLHGSESNDYIKKLKTATNAMIIKAFSVNDRTDIEYANQSLADLIILDHGKGGTGESFDWELTRMMTRPFILAGGLNGQNMGHALKTTQPYGVDVSSGVETDNVKDLEKIKEVINIVRNAQ